MLIKKFSTVTLEAAPPWAPYPAVRNEKLVSEKEE